MAIDSKEKRQAIVTIGLAFVRGTFPIATPDLQWRMSVGNVYGGNALSPGGAVADTNDFYRLLLSASDL